MDNTFTDFRLGWEEWVALHDLGLPALEAKIDTGAKTSALHAKDIEPFGSASKPQVRFTVQPIHNSPQVSIPCAAPIIDHRPSGRHLLQRSDRTTLCHSEQRFCWEPQLAY
mgnify:CR=1 FL=1